MKFFLCPRISRQFFCPICNVLENHDLGKTSLPPNFFWLVRLWSNRTIKREDFFTDHCDFGLNGENLWLLKSEEFSFFKDHLDFRHELGEN